MSVSQHGDHANGTSPVLRLLVRITRTIAVITGGIGCLVSFPEHIPWMLGTAIFVILMAIWRKQNLAWLLFFIPVFVAVKWPEFHWSMTVLCVSCICVALILLASSGATQANSRLSWYLAAGILVLAWSVYVVSWLNGCSNSKEVVLNERPVVCLGDSLTDYGYPNELSKRISIPVKDFGFNGYTTDDGIELIPKILDCGPQAVILELGGHDFKDGQPRSRTRKKLVRLIEAFQDEGISVVIVEIPRGFINDPYRGLERELAREFDLNLIPDTMIRQLIFWSPVVPPGAFVDSQRHNSDDGLHPNDRGNELMARYVAEALFDLYGDSVLATTE